MPSSAPGGSPLLSELFSLEGKTSLVTGGAGYLGREIAASLAELGSTVFIAGRDAAAAERVAARMSAIGDVRSLASVDVTDADSLAACMAAVQSHSDLDVLVNCAWSGNKNTFDSISIDDWRYDLDVCLTGVFASVKAAVPMLRKTQGVILNVGSMYGHVAPDFSIYEAGEGLANPPSYGAAKAGVIQLTKYLASALARDGVRVNCVSPGPFPFPETGAAHPAFIDALSSRNPTGRVGLPSELKGVAAFLCSNASSYVTGQNVCVDGGWAVW
jgi:NAD(P)-dependent dehydrogenase (short-subunit alcohol dehydrogenase family)